MNLLQRQISSLKSENFKQELEMDKKNKIIDEMLESKNNLFNDDMMKKKIKEVKLINFQF